MTQHLSFSAALLVGGESKRMGKDKALLEFCGETLWQRQLSKLESLSIQTLYLSAKKVPSWATDKYAVVLDKDDGKFDKGPIGGLCTLLETMDTSHLVLLAVDMPFMTADFLSGRMKRVTIGCGWVVQMDGFYQPMGAIYPQETLFYIKESLSSKDYSFQSLMKKMVQVEKMVVEVCRPENRKFFANWNSPEQING
ncbi:MAG: molybdenum cofactor guanylyltransferase [Verrucomicrobiota bacterium]